MHRVLPALFLLLASLAFAAEPEKLSPPDLELKVWDGEIPHAIANSAPEQPLANERVRNVSVPSIDVYLPPADKANGMAIVICSGGGYGQLASRPIGYYGAKWFVPKGIAVFSLKYRLKPPSPDVKRDSLADLRQTVRRIRSRAAEWHIDPQRIAVIGFSAGAHLTLNLATHFDDGEAKSADPIARQSCRPNYIGLFALWSGGDKLESFPITAQTPPAFVCHAADDTTAPIAFAESVVAAWKAAGRPVQYNRFDTGSHIGFNWPSRAHSEEWPEKFLAWLAEQGTPSK